MQSNLVTQACTTDAMEERRASRKTTHRIGGRAGFLVSSILLHGLGFWALSRMDAPRQSPIVVNIELQFPAPEGASPGPVAPLRSSPPTRSLARARPKSPRVAPAPAAVPPTTVIASAVAVSPPAPKTEAISKPDGGVAGSPTAAITGNGVASNAGSSGAGGSGAGEALVGPGFGAAYLHNPAPTYPPMARRFRLEGSTTLRVLVSAEGRPVHIAVETSSGAPMLDEAAQDAVRRWSFVPARRGNTPVAAEVRVPLRFHLNGITDVQPGN